jgi:hypothetical protein
MQSNFKDFTIFYNKALLAARRTARPEEPIQFAIAHTVHPQLADMLANGFCNLRARQPLGTEVEFLYSLPGYFMVHACYYWP